MTNGRRNRVFVALDFQNLGVTANNVEAMDDWIVGEVRRRCASNSHEVYRAYCRPDQQAAIDELRGLEWRVKPDTSDLDPWISQEAKSYCGESPNSTALFLCTRDGDFTGLVQEVWANGVRVYLMGPSDTNRRLVEIVGRRRWIQWPNHF